MEQDPASTLHVDEDDDLEGCYRHPQRLTAVHCSNCDRPICPDCAIQAAVGIKCQECGRMPRSARATIPTLRLVRGMGAAALLSIIIGMVYAQVNVPYLGWIIAWLLGGLIGTVATRASGGFRDPLLARTVTAITCAGFALPVVLPLLGGHVSGALLLHLIPAAAAAWGAWTRTA